MRLSRHAASLPILAWVCIDFCDYSSACTTLWVGLVQPAWWPIVMHALHSSQIRHAQGHKWVTLSGAKLETEMKTYRSLRKSLSKRADKQAEIRENTAQLINSAFAKYCTYVPAAELLHLMMFQAVLHLWCLV